MTQSRDWAVPLGAVPDMPTVGSEDCYVSAKKIARDCGLRYVEGCAWAPYPMSHAWCVDDDGVVVETSWTVYGTRYFGLAFDFFTAADGRNEMDLATLVYVTRHLLTPAEAQVIVRFSARAPRS